MAFMSTGTELINPFTLLESAGIRNGMTVADFGCGTLGHYVFPAAQLVGADGTVYAVDILPSVLSGIESRMRLESTQNIIPLRADIERPHGIRLEDNTLDMGMLINNLFLSSVHGIMMTECVRTVKRGGIFLVVDWKPTAVQFGPSVGTRVSPQDAKSIAEASGLAFVRDVEPGAYHYGMVFRVL